MFRIERKFPGQRIVLRDQIIFGHGSQRLVEEETIERCHLTGPTHSFQHHLQSLKFSSLHRSQYSAQNVQLFYSDGV